MENVCAVILAAGEGTRMRTSTPKPLLEVLFRPMLDWVFSAAKGAGVEKICLVTGHAHEQVQRLAYELDETCECVFQEERLGSAHAVMTAENFLRRNADGHVLVMGSDAPFIAADLISDAFRFHLQNQNHASVVSANLSSPTGYGRVLRAVPDGRFMGIVEEKDASRETKKICEVNTGVYWFRAASLLGVLHEISNHNAQNEYYLPDALKILLLKNKPVGVFLAENSSAVLGANTQVELANLNKIARGTSLEKFALEGLKVPCADGVMLDSRAFFAKDCTVLPGTIVKGECRFGRGCVVGPNTYVEACEFGENCTVAMAHCVNSVFPAGTKVPPFSSFVKNLHQN